MEAHLMPGLIVNGTITRTKVAPGADLVAYSGFSASNYLEQPYNSDLDFGTGDFCVMGWSKGTRAIHPMFSKNNGTNYSIILGGYSSTTFWFGTKDGSGTSRIISTSSHASGAWTHYCGVRKSGVMYLYENGVLIGTSTNTARNVTQANDVLAIGFDASGSGGASGDNLYSLFRISATAPTAEQIAKIYEDEKVLFQDNAQATLYGASDAVTALAYDEDTDLLHVGTSAGRSIFNGLRRVGNTTTSVSTAISASGGLVVEK
jgi:hypothetical protein